MPLLYQNFVLIGQKKKKKIGSITYTLRFKQVGFYHLFQVGLKISFNAISYT